MASQYAHLSLEAYEGIIQIQLSDRHILDELAIRELGQEFDSVLQDHTSLHLLIDFSNVEHLSSSALGLLITLNSRMADRGGTMMLAHVADSTQEVFRITRLDRVLACHEDLGSARAAVLGE